MLVFSFGVEKGKRFTIEEQVAQRRRDEDVAKQLTQKTQAEAILIATTANQKEPLNKVSGEKRKESSISEIEETSVAPSGKYAIQLITFASKSRAGKETEKLKSLGFHAFILPGGNGKFFQVCIDGFENMSEAKGKLTRLRKDGFAPDDAYIRPIKGTSLPTTPLNQVS